MIRKLLLPALFAGLLGGCVTGYGYRDGYYYGQPSVEYRYYDYGYPGGGYYPYGYGYYPYGERYRYYNYYGSPYYNPYYGRYPYYYNPYHRHPKPKPPVTGTPVPNPQPGHDRDDDRPPPWRDLNRRRRDEVARDAVPSQPQPQVRQAPRRESRGEDSSMGQVIRRAQETRRRNSGDKQEP